jgi:hypothetical protein
MITTSAATSQNWKAKKKKKKKTSKIKKTKKIKNFFFLGGFINFL